jgi:hypothetical protein
MATIQEARTAVNNLNKLTSPDKRYINAFAVILEASKTASAVERQTLQTIVADLVDKLPGRATVDELADIAGRLDFDLMIQIVTDRNAAIASRNQELKNLAAQLGIQIEAITADANKMRDIAAEINKATAAIKTARTLVSNLADADAPKKAKVQAVFTALEELGEVFKSE